MLGGAPKEDLESKLVSMDIISSDVSLIFENLFVAKARQRESVKFAAHPGLNRNKN